MIFDSCGLVYRLVVWSPPVHVSEQNIEPQISPDEFACVWVPLWMVTTSYKVVTENKHTFECVSGDL